MLFPAVDAHRRHVEQLGLHALEPGGAFVAYQVRDRVHTLGREVFGRARVQTELLNVPPMRIYRWEKHAASAPRSIAV